MPKVTVVQKQIEKTIPANELGIGQVGTIKGHPLGSNYDGLTVMRTYSGLVALDNPYKTWGAGMTFPVVPMGPFIITLEVD